MGCAGAVCHFPGDACASRESDEMRSLRYGINVTLDGCVHHEAGLPPDEEFMRFWTAEIEQSDAEIYGRVTYQMMESAWRRPAACGPTGWASRRSPSPRP
ncbi:hypothetical protein GCM10010458_22480 [Microbacterium luteolum]